MARHKKTQFQIDKRNRFLIGIWAGLFAGFVIGYIGGAIMTRQNVVAKDIREIKTELRIKVDAMDLERIDIDELTRTIKGWQMEIDEIWLYYGISQQYRCLVMSSEEGRPSGKD